MQYREAPNALYTLVEREQKSFEVTTKTINGTRRIYAFRCYHQKCKLASLYLGHPVEL